MKIRKVGKADFESWLEMGLLLWPEVTKAALRKEFLRILESRKDRAFLCLDDYGTPAGFITLRLRMDYVEGSDSSPVGYIEGIFVRKEFRKKGAARKLVEAGEAWALSRGCTEMGSDTELRNRKSQEFHKWLGFKTADTIVHFIKKLK